MSTFVKRHTVTVTTTTAGTGTAYTPAVTGRVLQIQYVKPASSSFSDGVDFAVTLETTGTSVWSESNVNASCTRYPRVQPHTSAGVAMTYDGKYPIPEYVYVANERVAIAVSSGGSTTTGTFYVWIG